MISPSIGKFCTNWSAYLPNVHSFNIFATIFAGSSLINLNLVLSLSVSDFDKLSWSTLKIVSLLPALQLSLSAKLTSWSDSRCPISNRYSFISTSALTALKHCLSTCSSLSKKSVSFAFIICFEY